MIIDMHTHAYPPQIAAKAIKAVAEPCGIKTFADGTAAGLKSALLPLGITRAAVLEIATKAGSVRSVNDYARENLNDGFFIPFAAMHPHAEDIPALLNEIKESGFIGVKMHPYFQAFDITEPAAYKIYEKLEEYGLILVLHCGYDPSYPDDGRACPRKTAQIAADFPKLKLIAAHMGGMKQQEETKKYLIGRNIYFDISMTERFFSEKAFAEMVAGHDPEKILFGSDAPWGDPQAQLDFLERAIDNSELKEKIKYKNAQKLLGIVS